LQLVPLAEGRILDAGEFTTVFVCVIATPKASRFRSKAKCAGIFCPTA
jgi:hypothetical protein